jgi:hypothetical protein
MKLTPEALSEVTITEQSGPGSLGLMHGLYASDDGHTWTMSPAGTVYSYPIGLRLL